MKNDRCRPVVTLKGQVRELATCLFDFCPALADFEFRIALADHINPAPAFHDLAVRMPVFQGANATYNFHRIELERLIV